jgi:hypothetical protein
MNRRRRKLQRFLSLEHWTVENIWWPIIKDWLTQKFPAKGTLYFALDRTQWCNNNLIVVSLIYYNRAIPIHFDLLDKLGNSNFDEQTEFLEPALKLLRDKTVVLLGDREFCGIDLAKWLGERGAYIALRLKKSKYIE